MLSDGLVVVVVAVVAASFYLIGKVVVSGRGACGRIASRTR